MHPDHIRLTKSYRRQGRSNPFLRYGLPLISIIVTGFLGIGHILQGRKDLEHIREELEWDALAATKALTPEGPLKDAKARKVTTLEEELRAVQQTVNIEDFEYVKVPKPIDRRGPAEEDLKDMSELTVVHSPRKLSFSKERAVVSFVEEEQDQRKRQGAKPAEVYGFVGAISTIVAFVVFVVWAYAPESWLHSVGITYYPDRYWAVALPAFFMATIVFVLSAYIALNHLSTPSPDSFNTVFDARTPDANQAVILSSYAEDEQPIHPIADLPLVQVNERMLIWEQ